MPLSCPCSSNLLYHNLPGAFAAEGRRDRSAGAADRLGLRGLSPRPRRPGAAPSAQRPPGRAAPAPGPGRLTALPAPRPRPRALSPPPAGAGAGARAGPRRPPAAPAPTCGQKAAAAAPRGPQLGPEPSALPAAAPLRRPPARPPPPPPPPGPAQFGAAILSGAAARCGPDVGSSRPPPRRGRSPHSASGTARGRPLPRGPGAADTGGLSSHTGAAEEKLVPELLPRVLASPYGLLSPPGSPNLQLLPSCAANCSYTCGN